MVGAIRPSLREWFTAYSALSPGTGFLAPVIGVMRNIIANLASASGGQDHTTLPSASTSFVRVRRARRDANASIASRTHVS